VDRLFLDANVLFSAAYRARAGVAGLWTLDDVVLATSTYAVQEAERNLTTPAQKRRLQRLLRPMTIVQGAPAPDDVGEDIQLPDKDRPILAGAIESRATHLITGDFRHFGQYFGSKIADILVLPPAVYLHNVSRTF
jgi:uncharacterized protein